MERGDTMKKVNFSDIFSVEYLEIITKYKSHIQKLLLSYDVIIFMARKAICFYKAMVVNGEIIPNEKCIVLSSRVLSYNIMSDFQGKRVAIIDDVVVRGKSISYSKKIFEKKGIDVDIHFVACEKEFIDSVDFINSIKSSFIYLSDTNIYQLSNYITEYIKASMIPYNVDQPIYTIRFDDLDEYDNVFSDRNHISNITDGLQRKYGIQNLSIHFNPQILKEIFGFDFDTNYAYLKIRFMRHVDSLNLVAIPFVLLPELSCEKLDEVFKRFFEKDFTDYIICNNRMEEYENKLRILQYVLSDSLFCAFSKVYQSNKIEKDLKNEFMQFTVEIAKQLSTNKLSDVFTKWSYDEQIIGFDNYFIFDKFLADTYDYIFDLSFTDEVYYDMRGNKQEQRIITFSGLVSYIKHVEGYSEKYTISSIIDILIDKGILIPSIVHGENNNIIRGYKFGEIYNLTKKGIELFAYMLDLYAELKEGMPLDKIELEKLCVLFFKNAAYRNRLFSISENFYDDCFSICYSKFGPRVSSCNKKYKVESKSALATILEDGGKICLEREKYKILTASSPRDKKWVIIAQNFALSYYRLFKCFENKVVRHRYVHTYNDFLTLLAIGSDRKNQMFSLMAELYLMTRIEIGDSLSEILNEMDRYSIINNDFNRQRYQGIMDGIGSGLWKYSCYCEKNLMDSIFIAASKEQSDIRFIREEYLTDIDENDENPIFVGLVDECGYLLYEIAYLFNYAQKRYTNIEMNEIFKKSAFYNNQFSSMRHGIKKKCEICSDEDLINDFNVLKRRALALVNKCDLCIEDVALNSIKTHNDIWVLFHSGHILHEYGIEINMHSNSENDPIRKCIFLRYDTNRDFEQQLNELLDRYAIFEKNTILIFVNVENSYEGVFESYHSATGDYFKELIRKILTKSSSSLNMSVNKVVMCTKKEIDKKDIYFNNFVLKYDCCGEVIDGYKYSQYILMKERAHIMKNGNQGNTSIFNGSITINGGTIGAIGSENTVCQKINDQNSIESFFKDIQAMDLEVLYNDSNTLALVEEIKAEADKKDQEGALVKLKNLAISVGSSVFSKMVSTLVIDVMKAKGYFPF